MKKEITYSRQLTNLIKKAGFNVSFSYGKNAGSSIVMRSSGFNVKKEKRNIRYKDSVYFQFKVTGDNEMLEEIKRYLDSLGYMTGKVLFNEFIVLGLKIK